MDWLHAKQLKPLTILIGTRAVLGQRMVRGWHSCTNHNIIESTQVREASYGESFVAIAIGNSVILLGIEGSRVD